MSATYSFGYWLRRRRKALDLTQLELAQRVNCAEITIRRLEADERRPSKQLAELLADQLAVPRAERAAFLHAARADLTADHLTVADQPLLGQDHAALPRHNLPLALSSFVGREQAITDLGQLLTTARLLTLTGAGGAGKTRLALEVAAGVMAAYRDGVWLVELAPVADPALLPHAVATALGVVAPAQRSLTEVLRDYLRNKHLLLLLDNCEHLLPAAAQLAKTLLQTCPHLRILATSRELLHLSGEVSWLVPPLTVPAPQHALPVAALSQYEAVQLFTERARARQPAFTLTTYTAPAVVAICWQLAGLPLAIELAAARIGVLSIEQIAERLQDALKLLIGRDGTADVRQQTLRATLDWSYQLLREGEQRLFARLAVFAGGWTLEAAEVIDTGADGGGAEVLEVLTQLVDKSLVVVEAGAAGAVRYRLLEPVRQYAAAQLAACGEGEAIQRAHALYYLALAEQAEPLLFGPQQAVWLARVEQEHANLRVALQWAVARAEAELGLRLSGALGRFWYMRGHAREGRQWLETTLACRRRAPAALRAKALYAAGRLATGQGDYGRAATRLDESLALFQQLGDSWGRATVLCCLGEIAYDQGDYGRAAMLLDESLAVFQQLGDSWGRAWTLWRRGVVRDQGDYYGRAALSFEESLAVFRQLGDKVGIATALRGLGLVAWKQGDYGRAALFFDESQALSQQLGDTPGRSWTLLQFGGVARQQGDYGRAALLLDESLTLFQALGDTPGRSWALHYLGWVAYDQGQRRQAQPLLAEAVGLFRDLGSHEGIAVMLEEWAGQAVAQGQAARAARLWGAAEALRAAIHEPMPPAERDRYERALASLRRHLDAATFAATWAEGRAMSLDQAIAYAFAEEGERHVMGEP